MTRPLLLAAAFIALASPVAAQTLVVPIDHSQRLSVQGSAAAVVVGNPQVADVTVVDSHTVFVSGRGYGETDVVVLDGAGRTIFNGEVLVAAPAGGRVSVYRGSARTDMACAPGCAVSYRSPTGGGASGSAGGTATAAPAPSGGGNPLSGVGNMIGGAVSNGISSVGHTMSTAAAPGPAAH